MNKKDLAKKIIAGSMLAPAILLAGCDGDKNQKEIRDYRMELSDVERGENISANDIVLTVTYTDGTTGTITITDDMIKSYDTSTVGVSSITLIVNGAERTFNFNVKTNDEDVKVLNEKFEQFLKDYKYAQSASVSAKYNLKYRFGTNDEVELKNESPLSYQLNRNDLTSEWQSQKMLYDAIVNSLVYSTMGKSAVTGQLSPTVHTAEPMAQFVDIIQKFSNSIDKSTAMTAVCDIINQLIKSGDLGVNSYADLNGKIADLLCGLLYHVYDVSPYYYINLETGTKLPDINFATTAEEASFKVAVVTALTKFTSEIETKKTFTLDNYKTLVNDLIEVIDTHTVDYEKKMYAVSTSFRYDAHDLLFTTLDTMPTSSNPFYYMYFVDKTTGDMPIYKTTPKNYENGAWVETFETTPTVLTGDINGESREYYKIPVTSDKFMTPDGAVWTIRQGTDGECSLDINREQPNWNGVKFVGGCLFTSAKSMNYLGWVFTHNDELKTMLQNSLINDPAHAMSTSFRWLIRQGVNDQSALNGQFANNMRVYKNGAYLEYLTDTECMQTKELVEMFCDMLSAMEDVYKIGADFTLLDWYNALTEKYDAFKTAYQARTNEGYDYAWLGIDEVAMLDMFIAPLRSIIDGIYTNSAKEYFLSEDFANLVGSFTAMIPSHEHNTNMYGKVVTTALTILLDNGTVQDTHLDYHDYIDTLCDMMASDGCSAVSAEGKQRLYDEYDATHQAVDIAETIFGDVNSEDTPYNNYCRQLCKFINELGLCNRDQVFDETKDLVVAAKTYVTNFENTEYHEITADGKKLLILMSDIAIDVLTRPEIDGVKQPMTGIDFANNVKNSLSNRSSQISEWFVTFMYENGLVQDENNTKFNDIVARINVIIGHVKAGEHKDAIEKMTTLIDTYGTQDQKTVWYSSLLTLCVFTDADVDYNELMRNVQLPSYINSVDYNKLVAKIRDGKTWTDMFTLDDITVETIQENGVITGEVVTLNLKVKNDLMIVAIDGSATVVFDIKF